MVQRPIGVRWWTTSRFNDRFQLSGALSGSKPGSCLTSNRTACFKASRWKRETLRCLQLPSVLSQMLTQNLNSER